MTVPVPLRERVALTQEMAVQVQALRRIAHMPRYAEANIDDRAERIRETLAAIRQAVQDAEQIDLGPSSLDRHWVWWLTDQAQLNAKDLSGRSPREQWNIVVRLSGTLADKIHETFLR